MRPLIFDFIEQREEVSTKTLYHYSFERSLNLINIGSSEVPFIDTDTLELECGTKTRVIVEADDEPFTNALITATKVKNESDDLHSSMLELVTKTLTKVERDDEDRNHYQ